MQHQLIENTEDRVPGMTQSSEVLYHWGVSVSFHGSEKLVDEWLARDGAFLFRLTKVLFPMLCLFQKLNSEFKSLFSINITASLAHDLKHYALETDTVLWRQNFTHIIPDDDDDGYGTWCWRRGTWEWFPPRDRWLWGTICPLSLLPHPPCTWEQWGPVLLFPTSDASLASSSALSSCSLNAGLSNIFLGFACCCQSFCVFYS